MTCHFGLSIAADISSRFKHHAGINSALFIFKTKTVGSVGITQESRLNDIVAKLAFES